ncbi:SdrD B-like domain-containing protein [Kitasatospora sp. NPDC088134]|uniref:SdrD B-like domain-containing protein n=1 Tax=Kitasatospora sp. NPDC088134 TaxID=3364071 RepID=UPI003824D7FB
MRTPHRTGRIAAALAVLAASLFGSGALAPPAQAAVSFSKTADKSTVAPGENVTYTLQYSCSVKECVNGAITDALPAGMEFVSWVPDPSTVDVPNSTVPAPGTAGGNLNIKLQTLSPGTTASVRVTLKFPNWTTANGSSAVNSARLTVDGEDPQTGRATVTAQVEPEYRVTKGVQTSSADGRTVTYQFSACSTDGTNVDLDTSRLLDTLPPGAVVDTGRSPGWSRVAPGPNTWGYDNGEFRAGNGHAGCRIPGVLVVNYPEAQFPTGSTSTNRVELFGDPLGPDPERSLSTDEATTGQFQAPNTDVQVTASKSWAETSVSGDLNSFSLFATNTSAPATSLTMTDPGTGTTDGLYNWLYPQSLQFSPWNPAGITMTFEYRLNGDPAWRTFTPGTPFDGSGNRRVTFAEGAGDPANDVLGLPAGRWLDGLRFSWNGPLPTGWSPGGGVQLVTQVLATGHDGRRAPAPLTNCVTNTATDGSSTATATGCARTTVTDGTNLGAAKTTTEGAVTSPGGRATFEVIPYNRSGRALDRPLVLYDVLPAGLVYVDGSLRTTDGYPDAKLPQSVEVTPGPDGRQIVKMTWPAGAPDMTYLHDQLAYRVRFDVQVAGSVRSGALVNEVFVTADRPTAPVTCAYNGTDSGVPDALDLNGNGDRTEKMCPASSRVEVQVPSVLRSYKEVKGDLDADYGSMGATTPGGRLAYRMTVRNDSPDPVTEFLAYDRLAAPGDGYVLNPAAPRGSSWAPALREPLTSSDPAVVIEYTTAKQPCVDALVPRAQDPGCDPAATWSTVFPGPGNATWFRIARPGTLAPGASFTLGWPMVAPYDAPDAAYAWNSFAYTATDATGKQLLPAEPAKVGVSVRRTRPSDNALGDFVWRDLDRDGVQQPGEPGVGGVGVALLDGNGDPVRDLNGTPLTTVTDGSGHYLFDHLPDGRYQVRFDLATLPKDATVTAQHAGPDPALDSDGDPQTGLTQVVGLAGGQRDLDLDLGILLPEPPPSPSPSPSDSSSPAPSPSGSPEPSGSPAPSGSPSGPVTPEPSGTAGGGLPQTGADLPSGTLGALAGLLTVAGLLFCALSYRRRGRRH